MALVSDYELLVGIIENDGEFTRHIDRRFGCHSWVLSPRASVYRIDDLYLFKVEQFTYQYEINSSSLLGTYQGSCLSPDLGVCSTFDGGEARFNGGAACTRLLPDGNLMWEKEYSLDEVGGIRGFWIRQETDSTYTIIVNNHVEDGDHHVALVKIDKDPPKGIVLVGNNASYHWFGYLENIRVSSVIVADEAHHSYPVVWYSWGPVNDIRIELFRLYPNSQWETLVESTPNDGVEEVIYLPPPTPTCRLRISTVDDTLQVESDWEFSILPLLNEFLYQELENPGVYYDTLDFGNVECGMPVTKQISVWTPRYDSPYLFNIREEEAPSFEATASNGIPGSLQDCLIEISAIADQTGEVFERIGIVTNAQYADTSFYLPGYWSNPDSSLKWLYLKANVSITPMSPVITLTRDNRDIIIDWNPVYRSAGGLDLSSTPLRYFILKVTPRMESSTI